MLPNIKAWFLERMPKDHTEHSGKHDVTHVTQIYELDDDFPIKAPDTATHVVLNIESSYTRGVDWICAEFHFAYAQEKVVTITEWVNVS